MRGVSIVELLGVTLGVFTAMLSYATFFMAYTHGYKIIVDINRYGEATVELFVMMFCLPFILYSWISAVRGFLRDEIRRH